MSAWVSHLTVGAKTVLNKVDVLKQNAFIIHNDLLSNQYYNKMFSLLLLVRKEIQEYPYETIKWKECVLGFLIISFVWELFLEIRQRVRLAKKGLPTQLKGIIKTETFQKSNYYNSDKVGFKIFSMFYNNGIVFALLYFDGLSIGWKLSNELLQKVYPTKSELIHSLAFAYGYILFNTVIGIPINWYSQFVIEQTHGFNKQTYGTFISDIFKTLFLWFILGMPFLAGFLKVVFWAGKDFAFYLYSFVFVCQIFFLLLFPTFIQPLFNKFTPLEEGSLKKKIEALAKSLKFPLTKLFVVDGSKRSSHSNAYFFGFFNNKRIVLFDTLIEKASEEEIVAVLAHELGHWHFNHVLKNLIIAQIHFFTMFYVFSQTIDMKSLYTAFGFNTKPVLIGFILFQFLYTPVETVIGFLMNYWTRQKEFQADQFATELGYGSKLKSGLTKLLSDNLAVFNPDEWHSMWHLSHPPLIERLNAIDKVKVKSKK